MDIRISNVHLTTSQIDIQYSNVKHPSDQLPGCEAVRWTFDIRMLNIHLGAGQMDVWHLNIHLGGCQMDV